MAEKKINNNNVNYIYYKLPFNEGDNSATYVQRALLYYLFDQKKYEFQYDTVRNCYFFRQDGGDFEELDEKELWQTVQEEFGKVSMQYLLNTVCSPKFSKRINPLKVWLEGLKYDGKDHIKDLTTYIELANDTPEERNRFYVTLKKWFVGAVKTLYDQHYVHKQAIIFEGPAGIGKTPFMTSLLPHEMSEFNGYMPCLDPKNKDARIALGTSFHIIIDEIDDFFKTKVNRDNYKSYFTQKRIKLRKPYEKREVSIPRIASILGTCNEANFLNDPTNSARVTVFRLLKILNRRHGTNKFVEDFQINKVWAQAYYLYNSGFNPEYTKNELILNEDVNELFKHNSPEFETLINWFEPAKKDDHDAEFMTTTAICNYLNTAQNDIRFTNYALGKALIRLKFERVKKRINHQHVRGYYVRNINIKQSKVITPNKLKALSF